MIADRVPSLSSRLIVLVGPTAVGKSSLALRMAADGAEIVSADSRHVYVGMDIGTAKPTLEERLRVPHHMIDLIFPDQTYSAAEYAREAGAIVDRILAGGQAALVVGGSGLYIKALLRGLFSGPAADRTLREKLQSKAPEELRRELEMVDPEAARRIHSKDRVRTIRALEVYHLTGKPISTLQSRHAFPNRYPDAVVIGLTRERSDLYQRIEKRVDEMIEQGLAAEVAGLLKAGYSADLPALQTLGYRHMGRVLLGEWSMEEAVRHLKKDTKAFAKRQLTWFRAMEGVRWFDLSGSGEEDVAKSLEPRA